MQKLKLYGGKTPARLHRGQRQGVPRGGAARGHGRHLARATSRTRSRTRSCATTPATCVNPFMVLNELESGLHHHSLITREEIRKRYRELLAMVKQEYEDVVKNEVQKAISADEEAIARLCGNYVDNIKAYTFREKVRNKFTGPGGRPGRAAHALDRGEDRHLGEPQGRLPPRDHELHRRPRPGGQAVRLPDQRAAAEGARAEALRGPEGLDQADERSSPAWWTRTRRRRSTSSRAA